MRIAIVGSYGVGLTMRVSRAPDPGETLTGGQFSSGHGGKGSNQAVAAARLGAAVSLLNLVIWVAVSVGTGEPVAPWWIWVAGPWGVVLALQALAARAGFAPPMPCAPGLPSRGRPDPR